MDNKWKGGGGHDYRRENNHHIVGDGEESQVSPYRAADARIAHTSLPSSPLAFAWKFSTSLWRESVPRPRPREMAEKSEREIGLHLFLIDFGG
jgi:hypothetical protein